MSGAREHFRRELATFEARKSDWIAAGYQGQWVAILGDDFVGFFENSRQAWNAGIDRWDRSGFMMREVLEQQRPIVVSHVCLHDTDARG